MASHLWKWCFGSGRKKQQQRELVGRWMLEKQRLKDVLDSPSRICALLLCAGSGPAWCPCLELLRLPRRHGGERSDAGGVLIFVLYRSAGLGEVSALLGGCILQEIMPKSAAFPRKRRFACSRRGLPHLLWIRLGFLHAKKRSS